MGVATTSEVRILGGVGMPRRVAHFNDPRLEAQIQEIITKVKQLRSGGDERPSDPPLFSCHFDTSLGKPIWWDGTKWVDAGGVAV